MEFKSKIGTTREQSERLLSMGLKPKTADVYLEKSNTPEFGIYHIHVLDEKIDAEQWFSSRINRDITPAWSLSRLLELTPRTIEQANRPNADLDINSDGQYWFISYDELGYDVKHQEMFNAIISMIEWLIYNSFFNKDYLK